MSDIASSSRLTFAAAPYLGRTEVRRIAPQLEIAAARRAYLPDLADLRRDWVASVAVPAFEALAASRPAARRRSFLTIGTGSGVDALAAIEILGAERVAITDLFDDVVSVAAANIRHNLAPGTAIDLTAGAGDLVEPLPETARDFDVIYENLPNLPLDDATAIERDRTSGAHLPPRREAVPDFVARNHLVLHWLALVHARPLLAPDGVVLTTVGARVPLDVLAELARSAGYRPEILTFGWKLQADPDDVLATHAAHQARGFGPFHFYEAECLAEAFAGLGPAEAGRRAHEIDARLAPARLDAPAAFAAHRRGGAVGHTVAVLASRREETP